MRSKLGNIANDDILISDTKSLLSKSSDFANCCDPKVRLSLGLFGDSRQEALERVLHRFAILKAQKRTQMPA